MGDVVLQYRTHTERPEIESLLPEECCIRLAGDSSGARWWNLWFYVTRDGTSELCDLAVPLNPNGPFLPSGPGGKHWGFNKTAAGVWSVSPSINVLAAAGSATQLHPGDHPIAASLWHHTPDVIGVPDGEPWQ